MATYTGVASKALRSRQSYRNDLATILRDTAFSIWPKPVMNMCLDEALGLVQAHYGATRLAVIAPSGGLQEELPADCVAVEAVEVADPTQAGVQASPLFAPVGFRVRRMYEPVGGSDNEDLGRLFLVLDEIPSASLRLYVTYHAARQVWGSWSVDNTGVDTATTQDLNPANIGDGFPLRLFWLEARRAAYAWATQIIESGGGRDYQRELDRVLDEREELLGWIARPGVVAVRHSLFG